MDEEYLSPREVVTDYSDITFTDNYQEFNTFKLAKNIEVRSRTAMLVMLSLVLAVLVLLLLRLILGWWALLIVVPFLAFLLFHFFARTDDDEHELKRKRNKRLRKADKEFNGRVFFPNSDTPVEFTDWDMFQIR